jgi:hypothetical protein
MHQKKLPESKVIQACIDSDINNLTSETLSKSENGIDLHKASSVGMLFRELNK